MCAGRRKGLEGNEPSSLVGAGHGCEEPRDPGLEGSKIPSTLDLRK